MCLLHYYYIATISIMVSTLLLIIHYMWVHNYSLCLLKVVVVTEYAEGHLFQILEDDEKLPESQVIVMSVQSNAINQAYHAF